MHASTSLKHQFLLAMPNQAEGYFGHTVTYICEHNSEGAMGLMVNRPMDLALCSLLNQMGMRQNIEDSIRVMEGGPVNSERGFILHSDDQQYDESLALGDGLMLTTARLVLEAIGTGKGPKHYLVALGYSGWDAGQLEEEMSENAWLSCPASAEVLFEIPFEQRVQKAAESLGIDFNLMSAQAGHA
ncbi:MAG: YqgE/AlgH family protein [Pseudomonadales bacterium]|nr:YqgE/AlgH family protein [Pseudomonadales bacterium]